MVFDSILLGSIVLKYTFKGTYVHCYYSSTILVLPLRSKYYSHVVLLLTDIPFGFHLVSIWHHDSNSGWLARLAIAKF
jgi:hypothetical protein